MVVKNVTVAVDLEPDARVVLVGVNRPTVCELVEEHQTILRVAACRWSADQLVCASQLDTYDIGGHPDPQLDELVGSALA